MGEPVHVAIVQMNMYMHHNSFVGTFDVAEGCVILFLVIFFGGNGAIGECTRSLIDVVPFLLSCGGVIGTSTVILLVHSFVSLLC